LVLAKEGMSYLQWKKKSEDFKEVLKYYSVYYLDQLMVISATLGLGI